MIIPVSLRSARLILLDLTKAWKIMSQLSRGQVFVNIIPVLVVPPQGIETKLPVTGLMGSVGETVFELIRKSVMSNSS